MAASIDGVGRVVTSPLGMLVYFKIRAEDERNFVDRGEAILRKSNAADPGADQAEGDLGVPFVWPFAVFWSTAISGSRELWCGLDEVVVVVAYAEQRMNALLRMVLPARRPQVPMLASSSAAFIEVACRLNRTLIRKAVRIENITSRAQ